MNLIGTAKAVLNSPIPVAACSFDNHELNIQITMLPGPHEALVKSPASDPLPPADEQYLDFTMIGRILRSDFEAMIEKNPGVASLDVNLGHAKPAKENADAV